VGILVDGVLNRSGTTKMIERVLGVSADENNIFVSSYEDFVLQVDVEQNSPLIVVRLGKVLPGVDEGSEKIINEFNTNSFLGTHIIYSLKEKMQCYTYKAPCWVDEQGSEAEFREFLEHCNREAIECYTELVTKRQGKG